MPFCPSSVTSPSHKFFLVSLKISSACAISHSDYLLDFRCPRSLVVEDSQRWKLHSCAFAFSNSLTPIHARYYGAGLWQMQGEGYSCKSPRPGLISYGSPIKPLSAAFTLLENVSQSIEFRALNIELSFFAFGRIVLLCPMYLLKIFQWKKGLVVSKENADPQPLACA